MADVIARLTKLETYPAGVITELSRTTWTAAAGLAYASSFTDIPATQSSSFTLNRPQPVLVMATLTGVYGSGGTANYVTVKPIIEASPGGGPTNSMTGVSATGAQGYQAVGAGVGNHTAPLCFTLPPGTYDIVWQYVMQGGATSTFAYTKGETDVFLLGG